MFFSQKQRSGQPLPGDKRAAPDMSSHANPQPPATAPAERSQQPLPLQQQQQHQHSQPQIQPQIQPQNQPQNVPATPNINQPPLTPASTATTPQTTTNTTTAATPETTRNKRARPTVSCLECRRKKLKCDRLQPCMQCKKTNRESLCTYAQIPSGRPSRAMTDEERRKRQRVDDMNHEARTDWNARTAPIARMGPSGQPRDPDPWWNSQASEAAPKERLGKREVLGKTFVKGCGSRYLGIGDRMAMLDHFEEAKSFIMTSFQSPDLMGMMREMSRFHDSFHKPKASERLPSKYSSLDRPGLVVEMFRAVPSDYICSVLVPTYAVYWETLSRILHAPTFDRDVVEILQVRRERALSLPPHIREANLAMLLATLALSSRLYRSKMPNEPELFETQIDKYSELVECWLDTVKGKERLHIGCIRVQTLLLLIRHNSLSPPAVLWYESGGLVRTAMIAGLHVDQPTTGTQLMDHNKSRTFSLFEKEQRRKLWRTILELDIQFSLAAGMPAAVRSVDLNMNDLRNLDDADLSENMAEYPPDKLLSQWTDSTPQSALGDSIKERLDTVNILGGPLDLEYDIPSLLMRATTLERYLHLLPTSVKSDAASGRNSDKPSGKLLAKILLDVYIRRPSFNLHRAIVLRSPSSRHPEARKPAIQSAIAILSHLDALDPSVADVSIIKDKDLLNLFHVLCKNDIIQAALMLCLEIRRFSLNSVGLAPTTSSDDSLPWTKHSLTRIVENTLNGLIQRLGEFGSDLKDILPLSIVLQSVRSDGSPEEKRELMRNGAERILNACRNVLPEIQHQMNEPRPLKIAHPPNNPSAPQNMQYDPYYNQKIDQQNGGLTPYGGDMSMLGLDFNFEDFDFGFGDWGGDPIGL